MKLEKAATIAQAFLGTRIGCAQCHNHKFDKWTQKQFYEYAAFLSGVVIKKKQRHQKEKSKNQCKSISLKALYQKANLSDKERKRLIKFIKELSVAFFEDDDNKKLRLPEDYAYNDAQAGDVVVPKVLFGDFKESRYRNNRSKFAYWLTSNNPRFTTTIVNRLWKFTMGIGMSEPVDDLKDNSVFFQR